MGLSVTTVPYSVRQASSRSEWPFQRIHNGAIEELDRRVAPCSLRPMSAVDAVVTKHLIFDGELGVRRNLP